MSRLLENWKEARRARQKAEEWQALPEGPRYGNSKEAFAISLAHCKPPMLVRAGQQSHGAKNYWETDKAFNLAILEWIVSNWPQVYEGSLSILKRQEKEKLLACEKHVQEMQDAINKAREPSDAA